MRSDDTDASLSWEHRELAQARIRDAACEVITQRGLATTVEDVARQAGVSVRTVFRYYPTRDALLADAINEIRGRLGQPVAGLPDPAVDLDGWLLTIATEVHRRLTHDLGRAFWDLRVAEPDSPAARAESEAWHESRERGLRAVAEVAWAAAGGTGGPPRLVIEMFLLLFSPFTTQAMASDFGKTPEDTAALAAKALKVLLVHAVEEHAPTVPVRSAT